MHIEIAKMEFTKEANRVPVDCHGNEAGNEERSLDPRLGQDRCQHHDSRSEGGKESQNARDSSEFILLVQALCPHPWGICHRSTRYGSPGSDYLSPRLCLLVCSFPVLCSLLSTELPGSLLDLPPRDLAVYESTSCLVSVRRPSTVFRWMSG